MDVVVYKGSVAVTPSVTFGFDIEIILPIYQGTVKIVVIHKLLTRIIFTIKIDPIFKIVQVLRQDGDMGCIYFLKICILGKIHGIVIELSVIGIVLKAS